MKTTTIVAAAATAFLIVMALPTAAVAQGRGHCCGHKGWGPGSPYNRMYNPAAVETVAGTVVRVERFTARREMSAGVHLWIRSDSDSVSVHLGPAWFIENQETSIAAGDQVEVRGSRVDYEGEPAVIAAEVRKGEDVLMLRDLGGRPVWAGWRRRP